MSGEKITLLTDFAGQANNVVPRICRLYCPNNTMSQVTTLGFLDNYLKANSISLLTTDIIGAVCSDGIQWYKMIITNGKHWLVSLP